MNPQPTPMQASFVIFMAELLSFPEAAYVIILYITLKISMLPSSLSPSNMEVIEQKEVKQRRK